MKTFKKVFLGVVTVMAAILLVSIVHHYQLRSAVDHYKAGLKASGEIMELSQTLPPPVAPERNGTEILRQAAVLVEGDKSFFESSNDYGFFPACQMVVPGKALISFQQPDLRTTTATNSWEQLQAMMGSVRPALDLLAQLPEHPEYDFQLHYELGWKAYGSFTNLYLVQFRNFNHYLDFGILLDLHTGNMAEAVKFAQANTMLVKAVDSQRLVISELVGSADLSVAERTIWEILQVPAVKDHQLAELQRGLQELDLLRTHGQALDMERLCEEISLENCRNSNSELHQYLHVGDDAILAMGGNFDPPSVLKRIKDHADIFLWRYWWTYSDELKCLPGFKVLKDSLEFARTNQNYLRAWARQETSLEAAGLTNREDWLFGGKPDLPSMLSSSISELSFSFRRVVTAETARRIVITAIALKRFQLKHDQYPQNLSELVPAFLAPIPVDPMSGEPLHYRFQSKERFLPYSVGENGIDDGGDPTVPSGVKDASFNWQDRQARDWVWPQVATPAEIQNFRDHPPK